MFLILLRAFTGSSVGGGLAQSAHAMYAKLWFTKKKSEDYSIRSPMTKTYLKYTLWIA